MRRTAFYSAVVVLCAVPSTMAANLAVITTGPGIVNFLILGAAVAGFVGSFKVRDMLRGGILAQGWQLFSVGFAALALAQILRLTTDTQIFETPSLIILILWALTVVLFVSAIFITKRHLS